MGEAKGGKQRADAVFEKVQKWIGDTISVFAASIFFLFGFGALYGAFFAQANIVLLAVPFALGLLAYYSRNFALIILIIAALGALLLFF